MKNRKVLGILVLFVFCGAAFGVLAREARDGDGAERVARDRPASREARRTAPAPSRTMDNPVQSVVIGTGNEDLTALQGGELVSTGLRRTDVGTRCLNASSLPPGLRCADVDLSVVEVLSDGPGGDGDLIPDGGETIQLRIGLTNNTVNAGGAPVDLSNVVIFLLSDDPDVTCVPERVAHFKHLPAGQTVFSDVDEPLTFVVGDVHRVSVQQQIDARLHLGMQARFTESDGFSRHVVGFSQRQSMIFDLELDVVPNTGGGILLAGETACVGGSEPGRVCLDDSECPGGQCLPLPGYLVDGGDSTLAGNVSYFEGFEGAADMAGRTFSENTIGVPITGTGFAHQVPLRAIPCLIPPCPIQFDGSRCQYSDPDGPSSDPQSEAWCVPWTGSDWHATANKGFMGQRSLRCGVDGIQDLGLDETHDNYHTTQLSTAVGPVLHVDPEGGSVLSIQHIAALGVGVFNLPVGETADRAYVMAVPVDPSSGYPLEGWHKIEPFHNGYDLAALSPGVFTNCLFDPYDDFHGPGDYPGGIVPDACEVPIPGVPPPPPEACDGVSTEDDYFDPNDPERLLGPSSGCAPESVFGAIGDYDGIDPSQSGGAETAGALGETGSGVWVNSLFSLDAFAGQSIRLRFVMTSIEIFPGLTWGQLFGNDVSKFRGWNIDDVAVSGLMDRPAAAFTLDQSPYAGGTCEEE